MEDFVKYNNLYDCYNNLLTEKECKTFEDYYFDNLSMQEIADNNNISKSAIYKTLQTTLEKLEYYETLLHLKEKNERLNKLLEVNDINKIKNEIKNIIDL